MCLSVSFPWRPSADKLLGMAAGMDISPMPGMRGPTSPAADSDAEMELSSPDPMSSVQSLGFALELPCECLSLQVLLLLPANIAQLL